MNRFAQLVILVASIYWTGNASATLIDRGNGMIYDSGQNLTWLQDMNYAKTSGYDADGLMNWNDATAWVSNLDYGGFDDWRLPVLQITDLGSVFPGSLFISVSEINSVMFEQSYPNGFCLGPDCLAIPSAPVFLNGGFLTLLWYGIDSGELAWASDSFFTSSLYPKSDLLQVWAVRNGDVAVVSEPGSLALIGLGLTLLGFSLYRKSSNN